MFRWSLCEYDFSKMRRIKQGRGERAGGTRLGSHESSGSEATSRHSGELNARPDTMKPVYHLSTFSRML